MDVKYYADGENGMALRLDLDLVRKEYNLPPYKAAKKEEAKPAKKNNKGRHELRFLVTNKSLPPALSAIHTLEEHGHRLIRASRLLLHILCLIGSATTALLDTRNVKHLP